MLKKPAVVLPSPQHRQAQRQVLPAAVALVEDLVEMLSLNAHLFVRRVTTLILLQPHLSAVSTERGRPHRRALKIRALANQGLAIGLIWVAMSTQILPPP